MTIDPIKRLAALKRLALAVGCVVKRTRGGNVHLFESLIDGDIERVFTTRMDSLYDLEESIEAFYGRHANFAAALRRYHESIYDVWLDHHGSVLIVHPLNDTAREWIETNVSLESWQMIGHSGAFACEPRMVRDLVIGMRNDGLTVP